MNIIVTTNLLKKTCNKDVELLKERFEEIRWQGEDEFFEVNVEKFSKDEVENLFQEASKISTGKYRTLMKKITIYRTLQKDPLGAKVKRLESLCEAMRQVMVKTPNKWIFKEEESGILCPYFIEDIEYKPYDARNQCPAHVELDLRYIEDNKCETHSLTFYGSDLNGNVIEILSAKGFFIETPEMVSKYEEEVKVFTKIHVLTGNQFLAIGKATVHSDHWRSGTIMMERDGQPTRVVMDDFDESEEVKSKTISNRFWEDKKKTSDDESEGVVFAPLHPYVDVFDLSKHQYVTLHVNNLEYYKYDTSISEKLVLPAHKKSLVDILVQSSSNLMEDIIKGKTGGIIVLATGEPGTGKTLTAEIYAETVKKPLYVVQCSQLGTTPDDLEKKLSEVLERAVRWGAILLIDEADVYIYERGKDISQNAIVGVFLRVLEYYRGILFLTSNRATIIDDAIISRCTAHIRYEIPTPEEALKIWTILGKQFKIKIEDFKPFVSTFPNISGRTIKNLLKLGKLLADKEGKKISLDLIKNASQFLDGVSKE